MPTVTPGVRTSDRSAWATSCRAPTKTQIPDQREPRLRQCEGSLGMSRGEQALAVVADGLPLPAVAHTKHPRSRA